MEVICETVCETVCAWGVGELERSTTSLVTKVTRYCRHSCTCTNIGSVRLIAHQWVAIVPRDIIMAAVSSLNILPILNRTGNGLYCINKLISSCRAPAALYK